MVWSSSAINGESARDGDQATSDTANGARIPQGGSPTRSRRRRLGADGSAGHDAPQALLPARHRIGGRAFRPGRAATPARRADGCAPRNVGRITQGGRDRPSGNGTARLPGRLPSRLRGRPVHRTAAGRRGVPPPVVHARVVGLLAGRTRAGLHRHTVRAAGARGLGRMARDYSASVRASEPSPTPDRRRVDGAQHQAGDDRIDLKAAGSDPPTPKEKSLWTHLTPTSRGDSPCPICP